MISNKNSFCASDFFLSGKKNMSMLNVKKCGVLEGAKYYTGKFNKQFEQYYMHKLCKRGN